MNKKLYSLKEVLRLTKDAYDDCFNKTGDGFNGETTFDPNALKEVDKNYKDWVKKNFDKDEIKVAIGKY